MNDGQSHSSAPSASFRHRATIGATALACFVVVASQAAGATFVYNFSTASASASGVHLDVDGVSGDNNDNWETIIDATGDGTGDVVRNADHPDAFFTGNYYQSLDTEPGNGDSIYVRDNDSNFSFAIPSDAVSISASLTTRFSGQAGIEGFLVGYFGGDEWGVRSGSTIVTGTGTAAAVFDPAKTYRVTGVADMTPAGTVKTFDVFVENLTDSTFEQVLNDAALDLGGLADPSTWDLISIRSNGSETTPAYVDDITISFVPIPEPSSVALAAIGLIGFGLIAARARRLPGGCR